MIPSLDRLEPTSERGARPSTWLFRGLVLLLFGVLTAQLWRLQVVDGQAYTNRSAANWLRQAVIAPTRGVIYDRNKTLLATNAPIFVISITPADVPKGRMQEIVIRVANELRVVPDDIQKVIDAGPYAVVRHPGYVAGILFCVGIALCLGSVWALVPAGLASALLVLRTRWEDQTLQAELPGYEEDARRVRYRLLPGAW